MEIQECFKKACIISQVAHKNQVDKAGKPYIEHPIFIASNVDSIEAKIVALLHDVFEDTDLDFSILNGFPQNIIDALKVITKEKDIDYMEYIKKVKENSLAAEVKKIDLIHNMDLNRLEEVTQKDIDRVWKYKQALNYLNYGIYVIKGGVSE